MSSSRRRRRRIAGPRPSGVGPALRRLNDGPSRACVAAEAAAAAAAGGSILAERPPTAPTSVAPRAAPRPPAQQRPIARAAGGSRASSAHPARSGRENVMDGWMRKGDAHRCPARPGAAAAAAAAAARRRAAHRWGEEALGGASCRLVERHGRRHRQQQQARRWSALCECARACAARHFVAAVACGLRTSAGLRGWEPQRAATCGASKRGSRAAAGALEGQTVAAQASSGGRCTPSFARLGRKARRASLPSASGGRARRADRGAAKTMTVTLSQVRLETDIPIEGCELHPFVNASRDNGTALGESEIDGQGIEWRWYKMVESKDTAGRGSTEAHPWTSPYRGGRGPKQQTSNDPAEGAAGQIPQHSGFRGGPPTCWLTGEPAALQYVGCPALDIPRFFAAGTSNAT
eukprot:scaffold3505_cov385-Prasinococcus_capsulatus_cf.AAC.7